MEKALPPPTTAPRSSDRQPEASQFSHSREVRDRASLISWSQVGLTPAPAPNLSGVFASPMSSAQVVVAWPARDLRLRSFPPPRIAHLDGSARDCLPGSLSGSSGWRFLYSGAGAEPLTWGVAHVARTAGRTGSSILPTAANLLAGSPLLAVIILAASVCTLAGEHSFLSSSLPMWLPLRSACVLRRQTAPALPIAMPALCFSPDPVRGR